MEMNAVREVAANMGGSLGSSINTSTNAGAQLASDLGKGLIQGTSQYIAVSYTHQMCIRDSMWYWWTRETPIRGYAR